MKQKVYGLTRRIPAGMVSTYGEIAGALGNRNLARTVGRILNRNPDLVKIPCHRVVRSDGGVGGYRSGTKKKIRLLESEGVSVKNNKIVGFGKRLFRF